MRYRIFKVSAKSIDGHPSNLVAGTKMQFLGYTSPDSIEEARLSLKRAAEICKVEITEIVLNAEYSGIDEVKEPMTKRWLHESEALGARLYTY